jgi:prolyl-tRNA synthetase
MGTIVDLLADDKGIVWPASVAPFTLHIISLNRDDDTVRGEADDLYTHLIANDIEVLYDDREATAGSKFADSDLIGIPWRVVVSRKTQEAGTYELTHRATGETIAVTRDQLIARLHTALPS